MSDEKLIRVREEVTKWRDAAMATIRDPEVSEYSRTRSTSRHICFNAVLALIDEELKRDA